VTEPPPPPPSDPPTTAAPATTPPTPATAPPAVSPPAPAPEELAVAADALPSVCDASVVDIVNAMNGDRAANGLGALCANARLTTIAQAWADHLAQTASFEHQDLWGVVATTPFRALAENLLRGPPSVAVDQMEAAWMASPGHRLNILGADYLAAGVGIAHGPDGRISVVVEFGGLVR
jgi:uncharacterized protein YkwD